MNVLVVGATGMVGQAVLRECLLDTRVERVVTLGRSMSARPHVKRRDIIHANLLDLSAIESSLAGLDACFYCLGVSVAGLSEPEYSRVTYEYTLSVATTLVRLNPGMTFVFVSGKGTDSSEQGRVMWARVKGRAENAILGLPFQGAYVLRPAAILPMHGIRSRTRMYRVFYALMTPVAPLLKAAFPTYFTTTEQIGRAMLRLATHGYSKRVLESADLVTF